MTTHKEINQWVSEGATPDEIARSCIAWYRGLHKNSDRYDLRISATAFSLIKKERSDSNSNESSFENDELALLVERARNDDQRAFRQCAQMVEMFIMKKYVLPDLLAGLVSDVMFGKIESPKPRGRPKAWLRDFVIKKTIADLLIFFPDIRATRNDASMNMPDAKRSACSIVTDALPQFGTHLSEKAVERIWLKR